MSKTLNKAEIAANSAALKRRAPPRGQREMTVHKGGQMEAAPAPSEPVSETVALMRMMERIATNPAVDVEKMKQVRELGQQVLNDHRRAAFDDALAKMQADLPTIDAKGKLEIRAKDAKGDRSGKVIQSTPYAKWEDINEAIKPILKAHGFGLRFKTGLAPDGRVMVTGILSGHGHREEAEFVLPHDSTGSKNAVQAIGSSTSYGKRYAASALLNLTSRGEDDDGKKGGGRPIDDGFPGASPACITSDQVTILINECKRVGCPTDKFLDWAQVATFEEIPASQFEGCMAGLDSFAKHKKGA